MAKQKKEVRKATMDIHNKSGWLVGANTESTVDIDESDSGKLLQLADLEDRWAENVKDVFRVQKRAILIEANATLAKQPKLFS